VFSSPSSRYFIEIAAATYDVFGIFTEVGLIQSHLENNRYQPDHERIESSAPRASWYDFARVLRHRPRLGLFVIRFP